MTLHPTLHRDTVRTLASWVAPDDDQERLRAEYLRHLHDHPDGVYRRCRPDHVTASALVMSADGHRALLVRHRKAGLWLQTGGHCEDDDASLVSAAAREALEETGIPGLRIDAVPLRLSRHEVPFCTDPERPAQRVGRHLDVQFLAVAPDGAAARAPAGEDPVRWFGPEETIAPTDEDTLLLIGAARARLAVADPR